MSCLFPGFLQDRLPDFRQPLAGSPTFDIGEIQAIAGYAQDPGDVAQVFFRSAFPVIFHFLDDDVLGRSDRSRPVREHGDDSSSSETASVEFVGFLDNDVDLPSGSGMDDVELLLTSYRLRGGVGGDIKFGSGEEGKEMRQLRSFQRNDDVDVQRQAGFTVCGGRDGTDEEIIDPGCGKTVQNPVEEITLVHGARSRRLPAGSPRRSNPDGGF